MVLSVVECSLSWESHTTAIFKIDDGPYIHVKSTREDLRVLKYTWGVSKALMTTTTSTSNGNWDRGVRASCGPDRSSSSSINVSKVTAEWVDQNHIRHIRRSRRGKTHWRISSQPPFTNTSSSCSRHRCSRPDYRYESRTGPLSCFASIKSLCWTRNQHK